MEFLEIDKTEGIYDYARTYKSDLLHISQTFPIIKEDVMFLIIGYNNLIKITKCQSISDKYKSRKHYSNCGGRTVFNGLNPKCIGNFMEESPNCFIMWSPKECLIDNVICFEKKYKNKLKVKCKIGNK